VLVSSLQSFAEYQQSRAWTWEQQALVRARAVAGDTSVCARFEQIRCEVLTRERDPEALKVDVIAMRRRMRDELDRSDGIRFDLKQGEGGLVDLEFLLQERVLALAATHASLCRLNDTPALLRELSALGGLAATNPEALLAAHGTLLARGLDCTLDRRPRITQEDDAIAQARQVVREACAAQALPFSRS
jgi:[glutamine synthetase] adenylyltransferase / [glutamine synthetase]-adenylyl-L-tyrosine phosphorylase